jgi:hypothetical protein
MDGKDTSFSRKQQLVLNNPFTIHNNNPKWPDGLASYSLGVKHQRTTEVTGPEHVIFLFPGMVNWMVCYSAALNSGAQEQFGLSAAHGINQGGDDIIQMYNEVSEEAHNQFKDTLILTEQVNKVVEWRPVSIGMRLYCANTDRQNEGWIECCRVPHGQVREFFGVTYRSIIEGDVDSENHISAIRDQDTNFPHKRCLIANGFLVPHSKFVNKLTRTYYEKYPFRLSQLPGYATMPFKDVSDYQFLLNPNKHYNEFNTVRNIHIDGAEHWIFDDQFFTDISTPTYRIHDNLLYSSRFYRNHYHGPGTGPAPQTVEGTTYMDQGLSSNAFDTIVIRFHGTANSRLVIHTAANYEYMTTNEQTTGVTVTYADVPMVTRHVETRNAYHKLPFDSKGAYPDTKY